MTAVTFPLRPPRLAFAICGRRWQNDVHEIKYSVCVNIIKQHRGKQGKTRENRGKHRNTGKNIGNSRKRRHSRNRSTLRVAS